MLIKLYVKEEMIGELSNFLKSEIKYEHSIEYSLHPYGYPVPQVLVNHEELVMLEDCKMEKQNYESNDL
jgi:hypothetical protein